MNDLEVLARTLWGEARGEGMEGMAAVANVVMNRVFAPGHPFGEGVQGVCLKPWQFSCWNPHDPNYPLLTTEREPGGHAWDEAKVLASAALDGLLPDRTDGATHYVVASIEKPGWSFTMDRTTVIGHHAFYRARPRVALPP